MNKGYLKGHVLTNLKFNNMILRRRRLIYPYSH